MSDHIGSTAEIISFAKSSDAEEFIICTEDGVLYRLLEENPEKRFFFPDPRPCCTDMKLNTVEGVLSVLMNENNEIKINEDKRNSALIPLEKMLELAK